MAVLNITPDSFSDGGQYDAGDLIAIEAKIKQVIANGATIIDVGGQSTRPSATKISWQEELGRIRPVIECIRSIPEAQKIAVSVDTFYAEVARGAVAAGADIINDVSGGLLDPQMLPLIAELQVTIVLMHMRGTPEDMNDLTDYPEGVVIGVAKELLERLKAAEEAGIPRWRIVLDPGIGFAKTQAQNLELLRNLEALRSYPGLRNYPWLVGTSRKGFIGKITGVSTAAERGWGTAATVTTSIAGGADIVRVHDVPEMAQVAKMADAMYRVEPKSKKTSSTASGLSRPPSTITDNESERGRSKGLKLSRRFYEAIVRSRSEVGLTTASLQNPAKGYSHQSVKFVPELKARARTGHNFAFSRSRI
jgi:2-amino-4-hydroxy-6-hydroxymethyldihydropteridine diphosphokinase/dihydropteroate synthase